MKVEHGSKITIESQGSRVSGTVLTAWNAANRGDPENWYIELIRDDGGYGYWKQLIDGGRIVSVKKPS
jgi:hypothetical protein